ncbi:ribonuclease domain-containing protein [uncultured Arthrobacter sp.]|uniref:ribonuclease domain-containing protein n=1 Tax=uncultured Arthrobacter sp. TaxID=114050 RepID=UPI003217CE54
MKTRRLTALIAVLLGLVVLGFVLGGIPQTGTAPPADGRAASSGSATASRAPAPGPVPSSGVANPSRLPEINASSLPPEARRVLALIARGGPYPYSRDNVTFKNLERILPRKASGYYREFTVPTPGVTSRGARRIVTGATGEKYYTADHYESFKFIVEGK